MKEIFEKLKNPKVYIPCIVVAVLLVVGVGLGIYFDVKENQRIDAEAVTLKEDLTVEFGEKVKVSDFLANLNGELVDDYIVNTENLGEQEVSFDFINIKNKKRTRSFTINVVDRTAPIISGGVTRTVNLGYIEDLTGLFLSGDDLDDAPKREVLGIYDLDKVGSYELEYIITDASGNQAKRFFTLNVVKPLSDTGEEYEIEKLPIAEVIAKHKNSKTKIGIDVSQWQGEVDWKRVKAAGVEFAFVRIGYQKGYDGEYILDPYFYDNIDGAKAAGLMVGTYFYSYATRPEEAQKQAEWVVEKLEGRELELGIAFDWEDWGGFNWAGMSFRTINKAAEAFIETVEEAEYEGLLYSSTSFLELIWRPEDFKKIWLAQYYDWVTYEGEYDFWQMSSSGRVPGVDGDVDIDIMYLE